MRIRGAAAPPACVPDPHPDLPDLQPSDTVGQRYHGIVRVALAIVVLLAATGAATAAAGPSGVKVSAAGYPLVCGRPTGSLKVVFPASTKLPATIAAKTVLLNSVRPARVSISGQAITITAARPTGIMCHSISLGVLEIAFTRAAHVELGSTRTAKILRATLTLSAKVTPSA